ncbi:MAG: zinc-ribbon domain-containing protein, partial [Christensenellaceae bacterium]|nr:zinc-ribbon domain-containing protein [Christensenellaceae bacterium]
MERCPKCGNKLSNVDVLCPRCGALVEVIQVKNSFVPPPPKPPESTPPACERPNLVIYNEDFPGDEPAAEEPAADEESILDIVEKEPDFPDLLPAEEDTSSSQPSVTQPVQPFIPERLYETPQDMEREIQAESRMARRARQRKWPEPQDAEQPPPRVSEEPESRLSRRATRQSTLSDSEEQLLKEADQLTSRASWRARVTGMPDDAETPAVPEEPLSPVSADAELSAQPAERTIPRYRAEYRESLRRSGSSRESKRRMPVPAAILLWVIVAAVLFLGFYYLNQHVMT